MWQQGRTSWEEAMLGQGVSEAGHSYPALPTGKSGRQMLVDRTFYSG